MQLINRAVDFGGWKWTVNQIIELFRGFDWYVTHAQKRRSGGREDLLRFWAMHYQSFYFCCKRQKSLH